MKPKFLRRSGLLPLVSTITLALGAPFAHAASETWDGGGASGIWGGVGNWVSNVPASGANNTATFANTYGTYPSQYNIIVNTAVTIGNIDFTGTTNDITISQINSAVFTLSATTPTVTVSNAARKLTISAPISGTSGFTKAGPGTLALTSATNNYSGNTNVAAGTLNNSGKISGLVASSKLNIAPTTGNNAIVNYTGGTSALFAVTGATVANTASAFNMSGGSLTITPGVTTSTQNVVGANSAYGYYNITGGTFRDSTGTAGGARFTLYQPRHRLGHQRHGNGCANWRDLRGRHRASSITPTPNGGSTTASGKSPWRILARSITPAAPTLRHLHEPCGQCHRRWLWRAESRGIGCPGRSSERSRSASATARPATQGSGQSGFVNVAAGTLSVGANANESLPGCPRRINNAYFNFAGGTVKATANLSGWIPLSTASINYNSNLFGAVDKSRGTSNFTGGLTLNSNTFNVAIANPLQAPAGSGVTPSGSERLRRQWLRGRTRRHLQQHGRGRGWIAGCRVCIDQWWSCHRDRDHHAGHLPPEPFRRSPSSVAAAPGHPSPREP